MFAYISGKVINIDGINITILVENTGLGLEIFASPNLVATARENETISAWIHHHITDVSQVLFGFATIDERNLFKNLIKVSGIGGKTALNMLGLGGEALINAIQTEDDKLLATIPGIGKKTAQKIIVDLKGSINFAKNQSTSEKTPAAPDTPLVSSLVSMGYEKSRVEAIVATLNDSLPLAEKVKLAIKSLS